MHLWSSQDLRRVREGHIEFEAEIERLFQEIGCRHRISIVRTRPSRTRFSIIAWMGEQFLPGLSDRNGSNGYDFAYPQDFGLFDNLGDDFGESMQGLVFGMAAR
ncbi:MAG: hypothetical protein MZV70_47170 [Desulfobacterales bacterium]|nr:hypothetical protein [Desulfobacterales bacterium]